MRKLVFENGDVLEQRPEAAVTLFGGARKVLSTAPLNGGLRTDLCCVFNHGGEVTGEMKAPTYQEHIAVLAREMGLDPAKCSGVSTGADIKNLALVTESFGRLTVTAAATAGIDINGGRAGDPACWDEENGRFTFIAGTVNILLFFNADLTDGALTRALITCTEAKSAAVGELLLPSRYSEGIATGSGTDSAILVSDPSAPLRLTDAGKHSKLGELIGRAVKTAVKQALFLQTGACAERQFDVFRRMDRFGVTPSGAVSEAELSADRELVVMTSLYAHLLDELSWGLITDDDALTAAARLLPLMHMSAAPLTESGSAHERLITAFQRGLQNRIT